MAEETVETEVKTNEQVQEETGEQHGAVPFGGLPLVKPAPDAQMTSDARRLAADVVRTVAGNLAAQIDGEMKKLETTHPLLKNLMSTLGTCKSFLLDHIGQVEGL